MKQAILLSQNDNVATLLERVEPGETIEIKGTGQAEKIVSRDSIPSGHKVAVKDMIPGDAVIKYNNRIGIATIEIFAGQHVHVHNVKSARTESGKGGEQA
ncbi:MAG TPA: UxaA family hydrolase [Mesotoga infera]|jgi:altronate dehydratase small subunit|nr:UxaA family hydrolase [Mesotoga sp.]NLI06126.1 UxaA family hydrolase [Thermotogaceae bacterium]HNR78685.1 UxaA family hydrolase [Mesotoga infera]HOI34268.1 UxaA family hydrolase [Mesotoga infera]HON27726.1 UxaA family hydrolase [Mesotoga infera]